MLSLYLKAYSKLTCYLLSLLYHNIISLYVLLFSDGAFGTLFIPPQLGGNIVSVLVILEMHLPEESYLHNKQPGV